MARAPRTGLVVAFILVLFCATGIWAYYAVPALISTYFGSGKRIETPTPPRQLDVHPPPTEDKALAGRPLGEALSTLDYAQDLETLTRFDATLQSRLLSGDYASLEQFGSELLTTKARFPEGTWKLYRFCEALAACPTGSDSTDAEWQAHLDRLKAWIKAYPHSKAAAGVHGHACVGFAWKARGSEFAYTVGPEMWRIFETRLEQSRTVLESVPEEARSPLWFTAMQTVALGQGWELADYDRLFNDAVASEPRYQSFYLRKAFFLMPRWHGRPGDSEAFIASAADKLGGEAGDEIFAWVMTRLSEYEKIQEWRQAHLKDWPRMKRGLVALRKEFGPSLRLENQCLRAAGYARDLDFAKSSALTIHDRMDPEVWSGRSGFLDFRDWALCQGKYAPKSRP